MARESLKSKRERAMWVYDVLDEKYPNVGTFLTHSTPFELLVAVILSAQCTDVRVNIVTPNLFKHLKTPQDFAVAPLDQVKDLIKSINFFNNKALNIKKMARSLLDRFDGEVPSNLDDLVSLAGVGRKTANVVLGQAFGVAGITVDTHVRRVSTRLGWTTHVDAVKAEHDLMKVWPKKIWTDFSSTLILHGRHTCVARRPKCGQCELASRCPTGKKNLNLV